MSLRGGSIIESPVYFSGQHPYVSVHHPAAPLPSPTQLLYRVRHHGEEFDVLLRPSSTIGLAIRLVLKQRREFVELAEMDYSHYAVKRQVRDGVWRLLPKSSTLEVSWTSAICPPPFSPFSPRFASCLVPVPTPERNVCIDALICLDPPPFGNLVCRRNWECQTRKCSSSARFRRRSKSTFTATAASPRRSTASRSTTPAR